MICRHMLSSVWTMDTNTDFSVNDSRGDVGVDKQIRTDSFEKLN
jgi:hypothetical protein